MDNKIFIYQLKCFFFNYKPEILLIRIIEFLIARISYVTYENLSHALNLHSLSKCKVAYIRHTYRYICIYFIIYPDICTYLNNSCRSRMRILDFGGPLIIHQGKETGTAACHGTDAQYPVATPTTQARTHASHSRERCRKTSVTYANKLHTHAHPHTLSRRSEARNFLCDHIASGLCVDSYLATPPCHALPDKFHPDELTLSVSVSSSGPG